MGTFQKIEGGESAVEACFEAIRGRILAGDLSPGMRLPPERQLAETLGVNRLTLRSALSRLSASNLLSVRQGSGYVVRSWQREGGPDLLTGLVDRAKNAEERVAIARDLLAVRRQIAVSALERLADGVTREARSAITLALGRFTELAHAKAPLAEIVDADLEVMGAVALATGSPVFALCMNPIGAVLRAMPGLSEAMFQHPLDSVAGYEALLMWLAAPSREGIPMMLGVLASRDEATLERLAATKRTRRRS